MREHRREAALCGVLGLVLSAGCAAASDDASDVAFRGAPGPFSVAFDDCQEFAGVFPVPLANVASRVPADYAPATYDGVSGFVVFRTVQCEGLVFDDGEAEDGSTIISQVGVNLFAPQGEGDINNYALHYSSTSKDLVQRLKHAGIDAKRIDDLEFEFDDGEYTIVNPKKQYRHRIEGPASDPPASDPGIPFLANWWQDDGPTNIVMSTDIPALFQGDGSQVQVTTKPNSAVAELLGGTVTAPSVFAIRGIIPDAVMDVAPVEL
jgi:hypothetical protein